MNNHVITYIMTTVLGICAILGAFSIRKLAKAFRWLVLQLFAAMLAELIGQAFKYYRLETSIIFNCYILLEFLFLMLPLLGWQHSKGRASTFTIIILFYAAIWFSSMFLQGMDIFATYTFLSGAVILTSTYLYVAVRLATVTTNIEREPVLWLAIAIILYFGGIVPLFAMFQYFIQQGKTELGSALYTINDVLAIIRYGLTIYAFYLLRKMVENK